jgi:hypothetical protein
MLNVDLVALLAIQVLYAIASLALISVGLAIIFGMMRVINLAHGEFLMLGGYAAIVATSHGINIWIAMLVVAPVVVGIIGVIVERTIIRFLYGRMIDTMLATWGLSLFWWADEGNLRQPPRSRQGLPAHEQTGSGPRPPRRRDDDVPRDGHAVLAGAGGGGDASAVVAAAAFEAPTVVVGLGDVTVVGQTVERRGRMSANGMDRLLPPAGIVCKNYTAAPARRCDQVPVSGPLRQTFPARQSRHHQS